jgi:hypothetical protein
MPDPIFLTLFFVTPFLDKYFIRQRKLERFENTQTAQTQDPRGNQGSDQDAGGQRRS